MSRMWEVDPETRTKVRPSKLAHRNGPKATDKRATAPPNLQDERKRQVLRLRRPLASMGKKHPIQPIPLISPRETRQDKTRQKRNRTPVTTPQPHSQTYPLTLRPTGQKQTGLPKIWHIHLPQLRRHPPRP